MSRKSVSGSSTMMSMDGEEPGLKTISEHSSLISQTSSDDVNMISFDFQCSLFRVTQHERQDELDSMKMEDLNTRASVILTEKFPDQSASYPTLGQRLLLYRHDPQVANILQLIRSPKDICHHDVIEVVLSVEAAKDKVNISKHSLSVHSYKGPTFCDYCDEFLWGLVKQGLKCTACGKNFHKRCVYHIPNDCEGVRPSRKRPGPNSSTSSLPPTTPDLSRADTNSTMDRRTSITSLSGPGEPQVKRASVGMTGRPIEIDWIVNTRPRVPHSFVIHTYPPNRPTQCKNCKTLLKGIRQQGLQCRDCKYNACKKCVNGEGIGDDCPGDIPMEEHLHEQSSIAEIPDDDRLMDDRSSNDDTGMLMEEPTAETITRDISKMSPLTINDAGKMIPAIRLYNSMRRNTSQRNKVCCEGWLIHFTNKDDMRRRHFWKLDGQKLTLYYDQTNQKTHNSISLENVLKISLKDTRGVNHLEINCQSADGKADITYYIADDTSVKQSVGLRHWHQAINNALYPMTGPAMTAADTAKVTRQVSRFQSLDPEERNATDVEQIYQIFREDVLGSGQFGTVYGARHRTKQRAVAIKVVDKTRFPNKESNQLIHEVQILSGLDYPGIVKLYNMFENPQKIFVVMEKLHGDMLEMILSSQRGRLDERITKFLITQILGALRYLHMKNIVHCDLKPENVLTANTDSALPQVKLCDFGFARIIGEKSFRRSVVGTPAYLAPEVLNNQGYNRTLDMWSVGVIIYVSLSGTFPFNEDEDILDQIQNAEFMFPDTPWNEVSQNAIDLIKHLLQVKRRRRLTVEKALLHNYFQDYQTYTDLRRLEERIGRIVWTDNEHWKWIAAHHESTNPR